MFKLANRGAKNKLIKLFGRECFIDKWHIRTKYGLDAIEEKYREKYKDNDPDKDPGSNALTYHHIIEKQMGGEPTIENGALMSERRHRWFHSLKTWAKVKIDRQLQELKKRTLRRLKEMRTNRQKT